MPAAWRMGRERVFVDVGAPARPVGQNQFAVFERRWMGEEVARPGRLVGAQFHDAEIGDRRAEMRRSSEIAEIADRIVRGRHGSRRASASASQYAPTAQTPFHSVSTITEPCRPGGGRRYRDGIRRTCSPKEKPDFPAEAIGRRPTVSRNRDDCRVNLAMPPGLLHGRAAACRVRGQVEAGAFTR